MTPFWKQTEDPQGFWEQKAQTKRIQGYRDTQISYQVIGEEGPAIMLACGLGGRLTVTFGWQMSSSVPTAVPG